MSDTVTRLNAALSGRYRIERLLGEGGMATVYLADDLKHQRRVALKVLRPDLAAVVGAERFLAEIKTTANLQHPHILPLFDSGAADSFLFYVMPYVEGETLRDRIDREKQLPVEESIRIATAVAGALDYAHRHGVIHRDIKPANILLHDGQPVVSDFGIALAVGAAGGNRLTETGLSVGTPYYMSPEQATGDQQVGPPSDTYALACVLYEMLTGDPPYLGSTAQAVLGQIIAGEPVSLIKKRRTVPVNVDAAVRRALEKLPSDRFTNAQDFAKALADPAFRHGDGAATGALGSSIPWRRASIATAGWAVVATVAAVWALTRPEAPAPVTRYSMALPADQAYSATPNMTALALTPDGSRFIYVGAAPQRGLQLWMRPRDQLTASPLPGTEGGGNPSVSPDGSKVAFVTTARGRRALMVATIGGGTALMVEDSLVDNGGVSWGHDGYIYYDGHLAGDGLARVPEGGGTPEPVTTPRTEEGEQYHMGPHALPNGRGVLFLVRRGRAFDIAVVDLATGQHRILVPGALATRYSPTGHLVYVLDDGTLVAAPFDQDALALTGNAVALADGVQVRDQGRVDLGLAGDGTLMYLSGDGAGLYEMVWVTRDGTVSAIDPDWAPSDLGQPALSPDGRQLAVTVISGNEPQIWLKQLDRGRLARFTLEGTSQDAAWSPDGRTLAFSSQRGGRPVAYRRPSDASAPPEILHQFSEGGVGQVRYSADGRWLLDVALGDLFGIRLDTTGAPEAEPVSLAVGAFQEAEPALSPDGRWLAYQSDESGQWEVYVCPFPSSCEVRHLLSSGGGTRPTWSRSGRELFYLSYLSAGAPLVAVDVLPGPTFDWGEPRALFDASGFRGGPSGGFDVAPGDERFVFARPVGGSDASQLVVVENFFRVLREQVGR